jgi:hypothetical protein
MTWILRYKSAIIVYFSVLVVLVIFMVLSLLSPAGLAHPIEAYNMHNACALAPSFNPDCFKRVIKYDFTFTFSYQVLADYYSKVAGLAFHNGDYIFSLTSLIQSIYFKLFYFVTVFTVIPVLAVWAVLFGYILIYDRISDTVEKWVEGIITGVGIAAAMYIIEKFFVHQVNQNGFEVILVDYPKYFVYLWLFCLSLWFAPDIFMLRADNFIAKLVLFVTSIIVFGVLPLRFEMKLVISPIITLAFALAYYRWRKIRDTRRQVLILLYVILPVGIIASLVKHWDFFTRRIFVNDFDSSYLAELTIDLIIFLLGFLFTYLEATKESGYSENNKESPCQETITLDTNDTKRQDTSNIAWLSLLTVGVIGILSYLTFRDVLFQDRLNKDRKNS